MEISRRLRSQVIAPYLWQETTDEDYPVLTPAELHVQFTDGLEPKLKLKPLSKITDEDAIEVAKLLGYNSTHTMVDIGKRFSKDFGSVWHSQKSFDIMKCWQFLQSKGYDLPNHLLEGKTLQEAGLATYE